MEQKKILLGLVFLKSFFLEYVNVKCFATFNHSNQSKCSRNVRFKFLCWNVLHKIYHTRLMVAFLVSMAHSIYRHFFYILYISFQFLLFYINVCTSRNVSEHWMSWLQFVQTNSNCVNWHLKQLQRKRKKKLWAKWKTI